MTRAEDIVGAGPREDEGCHRFHGAAGSGFHFTGVTASGTTGYTALSYYDDSYVYDGTGLDVDDLPIWGTTEVVTTISGAGSDFDTSIDDYTDGSSLGGLDPRRPDSSYCSVPGR